MSKLSKYNEFLIEKEFKSIVEDILILVESNTYEWDLTDKDKLSAGDTVEWDIPSKRNTVIKDEPAKEIVWDFSKDVEQQSKSIKDYVNSLKSGASKVKSKILKYRDYLNDGDPDIQFDVNSVIFNKIKEFIKGLDTKEQVKKYFYKLLEELKELPYKVKKDLFIKLSLLIMSISSLPIGELISDKDLSKDKFLSDIKTEVELVSINKVEKTEVDSVKEVDKNNSKSASFDIAQKLVKTAEAGYSKDRNDTGNWIDVPGDGQRFIGTNHGISAPVLAQYFKDKGINRLITKQDMMDLEYETAKEIYKKDYWDLAGLSNFKSQSIANVLYDECVNQGVGAALTDITKSMENMGHKIDEIGSWKEFHKELTPKVNNMSNKETRKLFQIIKDVRLERYQGAETWVDHGDGWTKRLKDIAFEDDGTTKDLDIS